MTKQRDDDPRIEPFEGPAGGWGSVRSLADILPREHLGPEGYRELARQNKPDGFMCVSCAWPKPADHHPAEFCEEGAKATAWELTRYRTTPDFFAEHTLTELRGWQDYDLEQHGRLTHPMRYDPATEKYVAVDWDEAFDEVGQELKRLDPKSVVFYSSGRTSLEASHLYGLMARMFGKGMRDVLLTHEADIADAGLCEGEVVALESDAEDGVHRRRDGLIVTPYDIPRGCLGAYYPEANVLMPVEHHAEESHVPASKSVPVRIAATT